MKIEVTEEMLGMVRAYKEAEARRTNPKVCGDAYREAMIDTRYAAVRVVRLVATAIDQAQREVAGG